MLLADACRAGFGAVRRSKRLLACCALSTGLASLPLAVYVARQVDAQGARRPDATEVARYLDPDFFADVRSTTPSFDADAIALVVVSLVLAFALRPLLWGGYAGISATKKRLTFAKFVREGGNTYWKFLRISAVCALLVGAVSVGLKPLLDTVERFAQTEPTEVSATNARTVAQVIVFLAMCLPAMIADYARVGVRMRRRPGVLAEFGRSAMFVFQHPFRTSGFYLIGLALEVGVVAVFVVLIRMADGAYVATSLVVLVLGQLLVALREATRLFHLAGAWTIREAEERPAPVRPVHPESDGDDLLDKPLPWHVG